MRSSVNPSNQASQTRPRTQEEVSDLKAARRTEIERRASTLQPPIPANVLVHIPSFKAAIQTIAPFDDNAWKLLKPRLIAQRAKGERRERQEQKTPVHSHKVQERRQEPSQHERTRTSAEIKQLVDKIWDDAQVPLRGQISAYADEVIQDSWGRGQKVRKDNSQHFAVDVLLYVRKRFYEETRKNAAAARAAGQDPVCDPPEGPFTQKLTLENMKWLFDVKIKPHTKPLCKELFLCTGCEGNSKLYGIEGVVQHYAAKHTSTLSRGNVVVYWRAEWPEISPFRPAPLPRGVHTDIEPHFAFDPFPSSSSSAAYALAPPDPPSEISTHMQPTTWDHFHSPLQPYPPDLDFHTQNFYSNYGPEYDPYSTSFPAVQPYMGDDTGSQWSYPVSTDAPLQTYSTEDNGFYDHNSHGYQTEPYIRSQPACDHLQEDLFSLQLEDIVENARELWAATTGLKAISGSARIQAVIYHTANRFRLRFFKNPPLTMFIHGLSHMKKMRPVRNVNGLTCKACTFGLGNESGHIQERKSFSLPQLVNHFQQMHIEPLQAVGAQPLDWTVDMVSPPDISAGPDLRNHSRIDEQQMSLLYEAVPELQHLAQYGWSGQGNQQNMEGEGELPSEAFIGDQLRSVTASRPPRTRVQDTNATDRPRVKLLHDRPVTKKSTQPARKMRTSRQCKSGDVVLQTQSEDYESQDPGGHSAGNRRDNKMMATLDTDPKDLDGTDATAEEEERRQEETIRALWASERAKAARLASDTALSCLLEEKHKSEPSQPTKSTLDEADDDSDEDLTAGLMSYLNQQEAS